MTEYQIQKALCEYLKLAARRDVFWCAIPNGEARSTITGARLKATGTRAGAPDMLFIVDGAIIGLELKAAKGRLSAAQKEASALWAKAGGDYVVAWGIDDALSLLVARGVFKALTKD